MFQDACDSFYKELDSFDKAFRSLNSAVMLDHWERVRSSIMRKDGFASFMEGGRSLVNHLDKGGSNRDVISQTRQLKSELRDIISRGPVFNSPRETAPVGTKPLRRCGEKPVGELPPKMTIDQWSARLDVLKNELKTDPVRSGDDPYIDPDSSVIQETAAFLLYEPVNIYNFVRNNVAFEPYSGFRKRPEAIADGGSANSSDMAALLIALLRASGVENCMFATANIFVPLADAAAWAGIPSPETIGVETAAAEISAYFSSNGLNATIILDPGTDEALGIEVADHTFVIAELDYRISRGARRGDIEEDYCGNVLIPLDPSYKFMNVYMPTHDYDPLDQMSLNDWENFWAGDSEDGFMSTPSNCDPSQALMDKYVADLQVMRETMGEGGPTAFNTSELTEIRQEYFQILPNTLPYDVVGEITFYHDHEPALIDAGTRNIEIIVMTEPCPAASTPAGPSISVSAEELASRRLTLMFLPAEASDWALLNDPMVDTMYDCPQMMVKPYFFLDADWDSLPNADNPTPEEYATMREDWIGPEPSAQRMGEYYYIYYYLEDSEEYIENKVVAGDVNGFAFLNQMPAPNYMLHLVDIMNEPHRFELNVDDPETYELRIEDHLKLGSNKLFREKYLGTYLQLQCLHYFKNMYFTEEITAALFKERLVRDYGLARVGIEVTPIWMGGAPVSFERLSSLVDVDHYTVEPLRCSIYGGTDENIDRYIQFKKIMGYSSSVQEHELFYREMIPPVPDDAPVTPVKPLDHVVSAVRVLQMAEEDPEAYVQTFNGSVNTSDWFAMDPTVAGDDDLFDRISYWVSQGYTVRIASKMYRIESVAGEEDGSYYGTGYVVDDGDGRSGYYLWGEMETGGAAGLPSSPWYFGPFGMEYEAMHFIEDYLNAHGENANEHRVHHWEESKLHWLTLGIAKEFRWRFRAYSFKGGNWRYLCEDKNQCVLGRPWLKVIIWCGHGGSYSSASHGLVNYLETVYRGRPDGGPAIRKEADAIHFENYCKGNQEMWQYPTENRYISWHDYNGWGCDTAEDSHYAPDFPYKHCYPSNFPCFNPMPEFPEVNRLFNTWLGLFLACNSDSEDLHNSIRPRVGYPPERWCNGYMAASGGVTIDPEYSGCAYEGKWMFSRRITRGKDRATPYCDSIENAWNGGYYGGVSWPTCSSYTSHAPYHDSAPIDWCFDIPLYATGNSCYNDRYVHGYVTWCPITDPGTGETNGQCPLSGAKVVLSRILQGVPVGFKTMYTDPNGVFSIGFDSYYGDFQIEITHLNQFGEEDFSSYLNVFSVPDIPGPGDPNVDLGEIILDQILNICHKGSDGDKAYYPEHFDEIGFNENHHHFRGEVNDHHRYIHRKTLHSRHGVVSRW